MYNFDSIDKNCLVYINNERIDGLFYKITSSEDHIISVKLFNRGSACILKSFFLSFFLKIYIRILIDKI